MTAPDLSNVPAVEIVDHLEAVNDERVARGLPARDVPAELGVDSFAELRRIAISLDEGREGTG